MAAELATGLDHPLIFVGPIVAIAGEGLSLSAVEAQKRPELTEFEKVKFESETLAKERPIRKCGSRIAAPDLITSD